MPLLRLFGHPALEDDKGAPLEGRATQRHRIALLALLATAPDGWPREKIMALLWPESPAERARSSLNESVYVLRRAFGEDAVLTVGDGVRLDRARLRVDVAELERALADGDAAAAVGWYRGPFLDGFFLSRAPDFDRWVEGERDRLARRHRAALEQLAAASSAAGSLDAAVEWRRRVAALNPYDASAVARLMEALAAAGDRAGALEQARIHATLMRSELELEPEPEIVALAERLRMREPFVTSTRPDFIGCALPTSPQDAPESTAGAAYLPPAATPGATAHLSRRSRMLRGIATLGGVAALAIVGGYGLRRASAVRAAAPPVPAPIGVAVLPFRVLSPRASDGYLAVGLPDVIITRLAANPGLRVRPTTAVLPFESGATTARTAGRALAVRYVVTGTVQRADSAVAVRAQLVAVDDGATVWAHEYQLAAGALLPLQDSIADQVATALRIVPVRPARAARVPDAAAMDLFLRGRASLARHRAPEMHAAVAAFDSALALDSTFAPGHAGLAIASAEIQQRFASAAEAPAWGERAVREARQALALDSLLPEAHEALAAVYRKSEFDWPGTIAESRRALALDPGAALPWFYIGGALYHLGLLPEAERAVRKGLEAQPTVDRTEALRTLGTAALADGRYAEALTLLQAVQRWSDRPVSDPHLAAAYYYAGDSVEAERLLEGLLDSPSAAAATRAQALLASLLAHRGDRARAGALLARAERGQVDHHAAYSIGVTLAQLGRATDAVRWLRTVHDTGFHCYPWYARDPLLAPLRGDAGFRALQMEMETEWRRDGERYRALVQ